MPFGFVGDFNCEDVFCVDLNLTSGNYRFILNFFENKIGSFNDPAFVIDKIAPNKKEIRLRLLNNTYQ